MRALSFLVLAIVAAGCGNGVNVNVEPEPMRKFGSESEFTAYLDELKKRQESRYFGLSPNAAMEDGASTASAASGATPTNQNITNNQEAGVDEGGIVKNVGDYLVVLRKGRLYAANVSQGGSPVQTDSIRVAPSEELNSNVWYDEMLVKGSRVLVIGYRYLTQVQDTAGSRVDRIHGATEVSVFTLSSSGQFTRESTRFFESNDYYSGENYASRLSAGRLILYMPYYAYSVAGSGVQLPMPRHLSVAQGSTFVASGPLFSWNDVVRPILPPDSPTFHSVLSCDITAAGDLDCEGAALLGEWGRQTYVSADRVFVWTDGYVYAIAQSDLEVRAHSARGYPRNQLSFKQDASKLHVLATRTEKTSANTYESAVELLSLPLLDFDANGDQPLDATNTRELLRSNRAWVSDNRFAESWIVFSTRTYDYQTGSSSSQLVAAEVNGGGGFTATLNDTAVSRIEALPGTGALVVGRESGQLSLRTLALGSGQADLKPAALLASAGESENRSHAFFFKPDASGNGGTFGLPILGQSSPGWWGRSESNVAFLRLDSTGGITALGAISASTAAGGQCEVSCVDWYGNTRPIFLGNRVFALMGSELQEAVVGPTSVSDFGSRLVFSF